VVPQTLVAAWQRLGGFRGETEAELRAGLRRILTRCQADRARNFRRDKRDVVQKPLNHRGEPGGEHLE
jgi:hypothetical protein